MDVCMDVSSVFGYKRIGRGIGTLVIYKKYFVELLVYKPLHTFRLVCIDAVLHRYCTVRSGPSQYNQILVP
jgi:hypothetical protein